ncbi:DNA-binding transcriptional LysR family regulator [Nakamurella sp. UYEF19]
MSTVILPALVRRLRDEHPACDIRLSESEADAPDLGNLDLLFYDGLVGREAEHLKLLDDPYLLVTRPGDFPDGPARITDLDGAPLIAWPATCDQPRLEQALVDNGARPRIVFRTAGNETILSMVRAGLGSAILPWLAVHGADVRSDDRLRVHELRPLIAREIFVHWPGGRTRSPLVARTIEIAVEIADEL